MKANLRNEVKRLNPSHSNIYRKQRNQIYFLHIIIGELKVERKGAFRMNEWCKQRKCPNPERWKMLNVVFEFCLYTFNTSVAFSTNTVKQIALRWLFHIFVSLDLSVGFEQIACIATSNRKMQMESECKSEYVQRI